MKGDFMPDGLLTQAHVSLLAKLGKFFEGIPEDAVDIGKLVADAVAEAVQAKADVLSGNYVQLINDVKSDVTTLKSDVATLTADVKTSLQTGTPTGTVASAPAKTPSPTV
jgi:hypothetical protein